MGERRLHILIPGEAQDVKNYTAILHKLGAQTEEIFDVELLCSLLADPDRYDALVIPGGEDIDPARYGQKNTGCRTIDPVADEIQFLAARTFLEWKKPVLGVCNGMQMINICFGGDLIQDLDCRERHQRNEGKDSFHGSRIMEDSWLYPLCGESVIVNSAHHQAVGRLGSDLKICQISDDGVVEAIESDALPVVGVQFHPEKLFVQENRGEFRALFADPLKWTCP